MNNTKWIYRGEYLHEDVSLPLDKDILNILYNRGITGDKEIDKFLNCSLKDIRDPFSMADMERAVERILQAGEKKEEIWIYGDYDVDGITSTSICFLALREAGIKVNYYIPLRDEGYGLNKTALSHIKEQGGSVIITVDCGISSVDEIEHGNSLGLDIIVTDHHEINNLLPPALAVINPKREDNLYPYKYLAGVGTAFMLLYALYIRLGIKDKIFQYLDIVAIGTIADIVPLTEENRIFTKFGLKLLEKTGHLGLKTLLKLIYPEYETKVFSTYDVGFVIAPVFNAAGRLKDAKRGVELFTSDSQKESMELSKKLIEQNSERKEIQKEILTMVEEKIEKNNLHLNNVIVVAEEDFHHGVIGIVASKIVDKHYKPTIIMEIKKDEGMAVASCRSIENFNLIEALNTMPEVFIKYGGHAGAAGFSIPIEKIGEFSEKINRYAGTVLDQRDFQKPVKIDKEILFHKISYDFLDKLSLLEPFGFGNPTPIFSLTHCLFKNLRLIGKDKKHIMFNLLKDGGEIKNCVWFNSDHNFQEFVSMGEIDVAFKLKQETFKDRYMNKLYIEDLNPSSGSRNHLKESIDLYDTCFPVDTVIYSRREPTSGELYLQFSEGVEVIQDRKIAGFLDTQTAAMLKMLKYSYNFNFNVQLKELVKKPENYNIHLTIERNLTFSTLAYKKGEVFKEIKKFILGELPYNTLQKQVLSSIFKDGVKTLAVADPGRGIGAIIRTIALFYSLQGKNTLVITGEQLSEKIAHCVESSEKYREGYDYHIYLDSLPGEEVSDMGDNVLVFSRKDLFLDGFSKITDSYTIPGNVEVLKESELIRAYDEHLCFYTRKLPYVEKLEIALNLKKYSRILATRDILALL